MSSRRPVVLVHGAWHGAWCWSATQAELDRLGVASWAIDLPGHGLSQDALGDLRTDAEAVRSVVASLAGRFDGGVVLVGHSYGGAVITEAAARLVEGGVPVAHLVYVAAFAPDDGESVWGLASSLPDPDVPAMRDALVIDAFGLVSVPSLAAATAAFYGCCDPSVADAAYERLCAQDAASLRQAVRGAPRDLIDSTYVLCTEDRALPAAHQRVLSQRCRHRHELAADHSPFFSAAAELAGLLRDISRS